MSLECLQIENVSFAYGPDCPEVLHGLCAGVPLAGVSLVLGPNAAGKTTLARVLAGLDSPTIGRLSWPDAAVATVGGWQRPQAAVAFEEPQYQLQSFELGEELAIGLMHCGATLEERRERVRWTAAALGLEQSLGTPVAELSEAAQLGLLAAALVALAPQLVLLDFSPGRLEDPLRERLFALARSGQGPAVLFLSREAADLLFLRPEEPVFLLRAGELTPLEKHADPAEQVEYLSAAGLALPWYVPTALELYRRGRLTRVLFEDEARFHVAWSESGAAGEGDL